MNVADSERITGWYESKGWKKSKSINNADEIVIVTCSVRQTAEDRVYGLINNLTKLKKQKPRLKIILTGCMLRYPLRFLKEKLPQVDDFKKISEFTQSQPIYESPNHAYVPIMEGCNQFCSYCVVPYARGREKSRPFEEILCEVEQLVKRGFREITLLGQNVNSYGQDLTLKNKKNFADLLKDLVKIKGLQKISFLTSNPWDLTNEIIKAMKSPKIDRYLHLPVQSGDEQILKKMKRHYTAKQYLDLLTKVRKEIPKIKIGTDIIVGFPGETKEQFQKTVTLCQKANFVKAYVAMYSPRWGTAAFKLKDDVPYEEKKRRWKILDDLINQTGE